MDAKNRLTVLRGALVVIGIIFIIAVYPLTFYGLRDGPGT